MPGLPIDTPDALDAATAAALQSRRERLLRIAEGKGIRSRLAIGCAAIVGLCAIAAVLAGDKSASIILALEFILVLTLVFLSTTGARRKALRELQEMKPPT